MEEIRKIAVSGSSGFIGSKLVEVLRTHGYEVWRLVRRDTKEPQTIFYDYQNKHIALEKLAQCDAVIHLAGKNILSGLWTKKLKKEIYDSRVKSTRFLAHTLSQLEEGPKTLLNASAVGIYGDRADQKVDEESLPGQGFLADLCVDWERSTKFSKKAGLRVVNMRFGIVLDPQGGMLKQIDSIFRVGLGSFFGNGHQYFTYVTRDQLIEQIIFLLKNQKIAGPVNMVAFKPTTNQELTKALGAVLKRRIWLRVPALLFDILGEQGKMVIASVRAYPKVLLDNHFPFQDHDIDEVLHRLYR